MRSINHLRGEHNVSQWCLIAPIPLALATPPLASLQLYPA
jgi:hypothetical protein